MQIQINTDKNVVGDEQFTAQATQVIIARLGRFREQLTRVEAHLSDENGQKSGQDDKKCVLEARPENMQPVSATHSAGTPAAALEGAADKLQRLLESAFGQLNNTRGRTSAGRQQVD